MKKTFILILLLLMAVSLWFYFQRHPALSMSLIGESKSQVVQQPDTNQATLVAITNNSLTNTGATIEMFSALTATNIEQWKAAIKGLKQLGGFKFSQEWAMQSAMRTNSTALRFRFNNK